MINLLNGLLASSNTIPIFEKLTPVNMNFIGDFIKWLIELVGSVGIGVILFTLVLKLITLPLDGYSRAAMKKNSLKMEKMRPQLEKLQKQYANDKQMYSQKMMALYKKEGYSMFGACLPSVVTLVFFIVVLNAFQVYSKFSTFTTFNEMRVAYSDTVKTYAKTIELDSNGNEVEVELDMEKLLKEGHISSLTNTDEAITFVKNEARESSANVFRSADQKFLWVKNVWIADSAMEHPVHSYKKFLNIIKVDKNETFLEGCYEEITFNLSKEKKEPNGFFIFVALSVGVTILSQWVMNKSQKAQLELQSVDGQGKQTQKIMMIIMPIMIGFFAFQYTAAFCIYMVSNSALTILSTLLINKLVEIKFNKKEETEEHNKLNGRFKKIEQAKNNTKNKK